MNLLSGEVEFIQTITVDINGFARGKMFPTAKLNDLFQNKEEVVGVVEVLGTKCEIPASITELSDNHYENMVIVPDKSTLRVAPWSKDSSLAMMFYDTYDKKTNSPWPFNPRLLAQSKIKELEEMKMKLIIGVENEFRLFDKVTKKPFTNKINILGQFQQATIMLPYARRLMKELKSCDIEFDSWNLEYGCGQIEIPLKAYGGMDGVDKVWLFREMSKFVADEMGLIASYMSVPLSMETGNGMHINHSLWTESEKGLTNVMWECEKKNELSDIGKHWLAGILKHTRALCAFFSPTVNCYRRVIVADWAPNQISWNYRDRSVAMRVKTSQNQEKSNYIENRLPSSACNIYLAIAGMIVAGIDGIKNKLELNEPGNGSHCENLPMSLSEALTALKEDEVMTDGLGAKFVDWFVKIKQETDVDLLKDVNLGDRSQEGLIREWDKYFDL